MTTQIDSLTIKDFEARSGVTRSNIYNRIDGLKKKGYAMEPEKQNGKSVFNADQIALMDSLDSVLKDGGSIAEFPAAHGSIELSHRPTGQAEKSYRTQDTKQDSGSIMLFGGMIDAIAGKVADILSIRQQETSPQLPSPPPADPLANLKALQEACDQGWLLSSSQLAPLVGLKKLPGRSLSDLGLSS
ncbi:MAG: hypothetical protein EDM05_66090 [Leptolyngbya sp. IPPAS B-1204]